MGNYRFLEHTADVMFEVNGKSLKEIFENAALATFEVQVDLKKVKRKVKKKIKLKNKDIGLLLFEFLEELIYLKDAKYLVFSKFKVSIKENLLGKRSQKGEFKLEANAEGEKIDPKRHELKTDVKAPTFHNFFLKKIKNNWKARVLLDI
jgi:SHS2 domain-containing protein|tara:strand:+ start:1917 stop:2363 length:447 start_codon:yes stop_codon:yes gene_type:complete